MLGGQFFIRQQALIKNKIHHKISQLIDFLESKFSPF